MRIILSAALPLALAACGPSADDAKAPAIPADHSEVQRQVIALDRPQQHIVFIRAILDADQTCQGVTESSRMPDTPGGPQWVATCTGGTRFAITVGADGTARVTGPLGG